MGHRKLALAIKQTKRAEITVVSWAQGQSLEIADGISRLPNSDMLQYQPKVKKFQGYFDK